MPQSVKCKVKIVLCLSVMGTFFLSCSDKSNYLDLSGTIWKVETMFANNQVVKNRPKSYILRFIDEDSYSIRLDVNSCGGKYSLFDDGAIDFGFIWCTEVCCDSEYAYTLLDLLKSTDHYAIKKGRLYLEGTGTIVLQAYYRQ